MSAEGKRLLLEQAQIKTKAQLARELGYSRTAVSLVLNGKYASDEDRLYAKAEEIYGTVQCPYFNQAITYAQCEGYFHREMPEDKEAVRHWRACKSCDQRRDAI